MITDITKSLDVFAEINEMAEVELSKEDKPWTHEAVERANERFSERVIDKFTDTTTNESRTWYNLVWSLIYEPWHGVIPLQDAGVLEGDLFSIFQGEPFLLRGYPLVELSTWESEEWFENEYDWSEGRVFPKYNGTRIQTFILPNEGFWGRTRRVEYLDRNSRWNRNYDLLLERTGYKDRLEQLSRERNVAVFGTLYGELLPGGITEYDVEIDYKAHDILERETRKYLDYSETTELFEEYGLPYVRELDKDEITTAVKNHGGIYYKSDRDSFLEIAEIEDLYPDDPVKQSGLEIWEGT